LQTSLFKIKGFKSSTKNIDKIIFADTAYTKALLSELAPLKKKWATQVTAQCCQEAFQKDWVNNIQISVRLDNTEADKLYTRIGFVERNTILALQRNLDQYPLGE